MSNILFQYRVICKTGFYVVGSWCSVSVSSWPARSPAWDLLSRRTADVVMKPYQQLGLQLSLGDKQGRRHVYRAAAEAINLQLQPGLLPATSSSTRPQARELMTSTPLSRRIIECDRKEEYPTVLKCGNTHFPGLIKLGRNILVFKQIILNN